MWANRDTIIQRAPFETFDQWHPILQHIQASLHLNPRWLAYEAADQEVLSGAFLNAQQAAQARERRMNEILHSMQQVDHDTVNNRMQMQQHQNENYLTLMGHEEFVNPETNDIETGSNVWQNRWVSADGDEFYSDNDDDPNQSQELSGKKWMLTPIRPR